MTIPVNNSNSVLNTALKGILKGMNDLQANASVIASAPSLAGENQKSMLTSLVDLKANVQQVQASAQVVKANDEMLGSLLDIKA